MWILLKAEIKYNRTQLISLAGLPVIFGVFSLSDTMLLDEANFFAKYFWAMLVGLGAYFLIFAIWSRRNKELRERFQRVIPVSSKKVSVCMFILGVSPVLLIFMILELIKTAAVDEWHEIIVRVHAQLGLMFILLSIIALLNETILRWSNWFITILVSFVLFILTYQVIHLVTIEAFPPLTVGGSEAYFYQWGLILSIVAAAAYYYRKSYLR